ncbi:MAG: NIPSNAP family protein [Alphaproteobacteria bacterium]
MMIDARTYQLYPNRVADFLVDYPKLGLPVQLRHGGRLQGYFMTISGTLNQAVHYWLYDGAGDRENTRKAFTSDPDWAVYVKTNPGRFYRQHTRFLVPTKFSPMGNGPLPKWEGKGIYEERSYIIRDSVPAYAAAFEKLALPALQSVGNTLVGFFSVDTGEINQVVHIWRWPSLDARLAAQAKLAGNADWAAYRKENGPRVLQQDTRLMQPVDFSPMQ